MSSELKVAHKSRLSLFGIVKKSKMHKTAIVEVILVKQDSLYGKYLRKKICYKVHDPENQYREGDKVKISLSRPISRTKRWFVSQLVERI